jgi:hypothetical protein
VVVVHLVMKQRNSSGPGSSASAKKQLMLDSKPNGNLMLY